MSQPIRILCVFSCLDCGGSETMCMNLYHRIDRTKIQFDFVKHVGKTGAYEDEIIALGGRIYEAPRFRLTNYSEYKQWWKKHLQDHPEHKIVHIHFFTITAAIVPIVHKMNRISIGHSHTCIEYSGIKSYIIRSIIRIGGRKVDYALACSSEAGKCMYGKREFHVLKNAIDTKRFDYNPYTRNKIRTEYGINDNVVIGHIGRFAKVKNHQFLINVFYKIKKKNENVKLMLIGDGPLRKEVENQAKELGIYEDVVFTGVRTDVNELLQAMDCFVFPSLHEGLGLVLIEAQTSGLPITMSDTVPEESIMAKDLVTVMSLEHSADEWADHILSKFGKERYSHVDEIRTAGYDISDTSKWIEGFYLSINK